MRGGEATAADNAYYQSQGGPANRITSRALNRIKGDWQRFAGRHRKDTGGNLLFADGHVQFFTHREVLTVGSPGTMNRPGNLIWTIDGPAVP
jgi:prepilin-type processing-associated H-X9-DG protein